MTPITGLTAGKLLGILEKSAAFLETDDLEVDVEHEAPSSCNFPLKRLRSEDDTV